MCTHKRLRRPARFIPYVMMNMYNFLIVILLFFARTASAQPVMHITEEQVERVDSLMSIYHKSNKFNGLIFIAREDSVLYSKGFGLANREKNLLNYPDNQFYILSITKLFTSALIMKLVEDGKLKLHESFTTYLPKFNQESWKGITIHHLLTQTSGLPNYHSYLSSDEGNRSEHTFYPPETLVEVIRNEPLNFQPGVKFEYVNTNYVLLGLLIEKVTGQNFSRALTQYITAPLKLDHTGYNPQSSPHGEFIRGYFQKGQSWSPASFFNPSEVYSAGGMYSTLADLFGFLQALDQGRLLQPKWIEKMNQSYTPVRDSFFLSVFKDYRGTGYGYGVFVKPLSLTDNTVTSRVMIVGAMPNAFFIHIIRLPEKGLYVMSVENSGQNFFPNHIISILTKGND